MCKQSSYGKVNYSLPKKALSLIVIAGLLAFPVISAGQILDSWKPVSDHHPNAIAITLGWAKYDMGLSYMLITGRAMSFKSCSGWIVWNHAQVSPRAFPALGIDGWSTLQVYGGTLLSFRYTTVPPSTGVPDTPQPLPGESHIWRQFYDCFHVSIASYIRRVSGCWYVLEYN